MKLCRELCVKHREYLLRHQSQLTGVTVGEDAGKYYFWVRYEGTLLALMVMPYETRIAKYNGEHSCLRDTELDHYEVLNGSICGYENDRPFSTARELLWEIQRVKDFVNCIKPPAHARQPTS